MWREGLYGWFFGAIMPAPIRIRTRQEPTMRVLGISGSPRRGGNTDFVINMALGLLAEEGLETEFVSLADRPIQPCLACGRLYQVGDDPMSARRPGVRGHVGEVLGGRRHSDRLAGLLRLGHAADDGPAGPGGLRRPTASADSAAEGRGGHRGRPACGP